MVPPPDLEQLRVVLVDTRNPLNIGAAARAMSNFGFHRLRVVNPYEKAFREARSAVGGLRVLAAAEEYTSVAAAVADCRLVVGTTAARHREVRHPLRRLEHGAPLIRRQCTHSGVALLFGSEKFGLSNEDLSHCDWLIRIPTGEENVSMNLGQAVAVCLYELVRDYRAPRQLKRSEPSATAAELERITVGLVEVLRSSGYLGSHSGDSTEKIRRLVHRLDLTAGDATVWLGILRQIGWKVRSGERATE